MPLSELEKLEADSKKYFTAVKTANDAVKEHLQGYVSSGRVLKGDEIVGWYGEIVTQQFLGGEIIENDAEDYDIINADKGEKYSVKTRKGFGSNWQTSSLIPSDEVNDKSPTHLVFVHLNVDYSVESIWMYPWEEVVANKRLSPRKVKKVSRGFTFSVKVSKDKKYLVYGTGK